MNAERTLCLSPTDALATPERSGDDPVTLEVVARRMQGIADSMGETLRRTAVSVNIRQRLDFSCAVFDAQGQLIANAPHVPVHLGAMGHTVRTIMTRYPQMFRGDVYVSNHPYSGGSHLPDVTVVSPVFLNTTKVHRATSLPVGLIMPRSVASGPFNASRCNLLGRRRRGNRCVCSAS